MLPTKENQQAMAIVTVTPPRPGAGLALAYTYKTAGLISQGECLMSVLCELY